MRIIIQIILIYLLDLSLIYLENLVASEQSVYRFDEYEPVNLGPSYRLCTDDRTTCVTMCFDDALCSGIAVNAQQTGGCDAAILIYYGRIVLRKNPSFTTFIIRALC